MWSIQPEHTLLDTLSHNAMQKTWICIFSVNWLQLLSNPLARAVLRAGEEKWYSKYLLLHIAYYKTISMQYTEWTPHPSPLPLTRTGPRPMLKWDGRDYQLLEDIYLLRLNLFDQILQHFYKKKCIKNALFFCYLNAFFLKHNIKKHYILKRLNLHTANYSPCLTGVCSCSVCCKQCVSIPLRTYPFSHRDLCDSLRAS